MKITNYVFKTVIISFCSLSLFVASCKKQEIAPKITPVITFSISNDSAYKFRLVLKDKGTSGFATTRPQEFLSAKAIANRKRWGIPIDGTDLPISPNYIKAIQKIGGVIVAQSKWLNTVSVYCNDGLLAKEYIKLPFVKDVVKVWQDNKNLPKLQPYIDAPMSNGGGTTSAGPKNETYYGLAWNNININNGQVLHENGFDGAGIDIAVMDDGFKDLKTNPMFNTINIKGAKSFVYENNDPYSADNHGVKVTSCMAVNQPGQYVGTAPRANYWLLRSEDDASEWPVEEDYWVSAVEYADSAGVNVINTSLSYRIFDNAAINLKYEDMDGKTALASKAAGFAAKKGMFIVCSAGNDHTWVGTPADGVDVLAVGAVELSKNISSFSSFGITVDGRIKPDVVSLGVGAAVVAVTSQVVFSDGTSFSSPIICGLAACLWQAYPKLNNKDLLDIFKKSADRYDNPAIPYGYGVPDMQKAMQLAYEVSATR